MTIISAINIPLVAFVFGATLWFFFFQSPYLLKKMGRDAFVPIQMQMTLLLFNVLSIFVSVVLVVTLWQSEIDSVATLSSTVSFLGTLINRLIIIPRAMRAGGLGMKEVKGKNEEGSVSNFVSLGVGNKTKVLHRLVVLFVLIMLFGTIWHGLILLP